MKLKKDFSHPKALNKKLNLNKRHKMLCPTYIVPSTPMSYVCIISKSFVFNYLKYICKYLAFTLVKTNIG